MQKSFMLVACHQVLPLSHHSSKVRPATHPPPQHSLAPRCIKRERRLYCRTSAPDAVQPPP